jgi:hypothetical protein
MSTVWQKLLLQLTQNRLRRAGILRQRLGEKPGKGRRLYIGKNRSLPYLLQVLSE